MIQHVIIINKDKLSGKLTKFFTGCHAYHTGWLDTDTELFYDQNLLRRRRIWPLYSPENVLLFDEPLMTTKILEDQLSRDGTRYGVLDYLGFGWRRLFRMSVPVMPNSPSFIDLVLFRLRGVYHLIGKSTRNRSGAICSETQNKDAKLAGIFTPWGLNDPPPSPCDWLKFLVERELSK